MINLDSINTGSSACFKLATSNAELFTILESVFLLKQLGMKLIIISQFQLFPTVSGALRFANSRPTQIRDKKEKCSVASTAPVQWKTQHTWISFTLNSQFYKRLGLRTLLWKKKDKNGNIRMDKNGNPMMKVKQNDFSTAIRSLIATAGLVEGFLLDDTEAHFVIQKLQPAQKVVI